MSPPHNHIQKRKRTFTTVYESHQRSTALQGLYTALQRSIYTLQHSAPPLRARTPPERDHIHDTSRDAPSAGRIVPPPLIAAHAPLQRAMVLTPRRGLMSLEPPLLNGTTVLRRRCGVCGRVRIKAPTAPVPVHLASKVAWLAEHLLDLLVVDPRSLHLEVRLSS